MNKSLKYSYYKINYHLFLLTTSYKKPKKLLEKLYLDKELRTDMGKWARLKIEELGDRKQNMQKLIDYFMGIIT